MLFPDAFERSRSIAEEGAILDVRGRLERRGEALQIVCESLYRRASDCRPGCL